MKTTVFSFICALTLLVSCQSEPIEEYEVIPQPVSMTYKSGRVKLNSAPDVSFPASLAGEAVLLEAALVHDYAMNPKLIQDGKKGQIELILDTTVLKEQPEGYLLDSESGRVQIKAPKPAGIMNGIQTLRQIIQKENNDFYIQKGKILDYPAFQWRAFMLDEGRYFKGKEVVYMLLDQMSFMKMNVFHWHLTEDQGWRIEIKKYPKLTEVGAYRDSSEINHFHSNIYDGVPHGGFYIQEEIKEIVAYAQKLHIMIVPEIEMPGHASAAIAAYPWLGTTGKPIEVPCKFGVQYDVYNVADPKVHQFLEDVLDEVIALFPDSVVHIGGDEVRYNQWNNSPSVKAYMKQNGISSPSELQVYFTNNISELLASKGKTMMGWNEITGDKLHEFQTEDKSVISEQKLAPGTIVHFWKGDTELMKRTIEKGYPVVNSTHDYTYLDYSYESIPLDKAYDFNPIPDGLSAAEQKQIIGLGCQMWGEFIPTVESMNRKIFPRIAAYAEVGWTAPDQKDFDRFLDNLPKFLKRWDAAEISYGED